MSADEIILGIETSCDETATAVIINGVIAADRTTRQVLHEQYGGVVPELASRAHEQILAPSVQSVLVEAGLSPHDISAVAVTYGPGLAGALLVGVSFAKGFSNSLGIPLWAVNHLEAHIWIAQLTYPEIPLPVLALVVSGGHTLLLSVENFGHYQLIGTTRDDAAGELFDKIGRVIGFPFPSGEQIDRLAMEFSGKPVPFSVSRFKNDPCAFSFSGIKTAAVNYLKQFPYIEAEGRFEIPDEARSALCAGILKTVARSLTGPIKREVQRGVYRGLIVCGGVSASKFLRRELKNCADEAGIPLFVPPIHHCTDNGTMIAYAGHLKSSHGMIPADISLEVDPSAKLYR